jgi:hypothetical protein
LPVGTDQATSAGHETPQQHPGDNQTRAIHPIRKSPERQSEHGVKNSETETDQQAHLRVGNRQIAPNWSNQQVQNLPIDERKNIGAQQDDNGVPSPARRWISALAFCFRFSDSRPLTNYHSTLVARIRQQRNCNDVKCATRLIEAD